MDKQVKNLSYLWLAIVVAVGALVVAFMLVGCSSQGGETASIAEEEAQQQSTQDAVDNQSASNEGQDESSLSGKTLVAYFSATGNTERVATMIADATGGDLYAIEAAEPYTDEEVSADGYYGDNRPYNESQDTSLRPDLGSAPVEDPESYANVFLGYPIWYGKAPDIIYSFLDVNVFPNAKIYPFCTSGSSSITESTTILEEFYPNLNWMTGQRFTSSTTQEQVDA